MKGRKRYHRHKCPNSRCGFVWEHENVPMVRPDTETDEEFDVAHRKHQDAHKCPKCGRRQTVKYFGPEMCEMSTRPLEEAHADPSDEVRDKKCFFKAMIDEILA